MRALIPTLFLNRGGDDGPRPRGRAAAATSRVIGYHDLYLLGGSQSAAGPASDSFS
jgi:hypothetical protein